MKILPTSNPLKPQPSLINPTFSTSNIPFFNSQAHLTYPGLNPSHYSLDSLIQIQEKSRFERISIYSDSYPFLKLRKAIKRILLSISILCSQITRSRYFELFISVVILFNTISLALEDPAKSNQPQPFDVFELMFLLIYTIECIMKILAQGLAIKAGSYFRDPLNILDFIIVLTAWLDRYASQGFNLNALRVMRILRPLRSVTSIKGLKVLVLALFKSFVPLTAALVILIFCLLIFAIAGLQLFKGLFRYRCIDVHTGIYNDDLEVCKSGSCDFGVCVEGLDNPWFGSLSFDNVYLSFIAVFQVITLEGWYSIMTKTQISFSSFSFLYFIPLVYFGSYLLVNLTQAIIAISFTNAVDETEKKITNSESLHSSMFSENDEDSEVDQTLLINIEKPIRMSYCMVANEENSAEDLLYSEQSLKIEEKKIFEGIRREPLGKRIEMRQSIQYMNSVKENGKNVEKIKKLKNLREKVKIEANIGQKLRNKKLNERDLKYIVKDIQISAGSTQDILFKDRFCQPRGFKYSFVYQFGKNAKNSVKVIEKYKEKAKEILLKHPECVTKMQLFKTLTKRLSSDKIFLKIHMNVKKIVEKVNEFDKLTLMIYSKSSANSINPNISDESFISLEKLNNLSVTLWKSGCSGLMQKITIPVNYLANNKIYKNFMVLCVIGNICSLCYDHYGISQAESNILKGINNGFTFVFLIELIIKVISTGLKAAIRDKMNYLDFIVVIAGLIEYIFNYGTSALNAIRAVRILRIFRLTKLMRILKPLRSLKKLVKIIQKSLTNLSYLMLLLLIFCIIFTLIGMQVFGGQFDFPQKPRCVFDNFFSSFLCIFQVLSTENWNEILINSIRSRGPAGALFFIIWIIIGNFVILNLILAILIQRFKKAPDDFSITLEENSVHNPKKKKKRYTRISRKKINKKQKIIENLREISEMDEEDVTNIEQLFLKKITHTKTEVSKIVLCDKSFFFFSQNNKLRTFCINLSKSYYFEFFILGVIFLNTGKLIWDTYITDSAPDSTEMQVSYGLNILFIGIYFIEFLLKSLSQGFLLSQNTYLRDNWNRVDFLILIFSITDLFNDSNFTIIKVFRLIRTLRPLKLIIHNIKMRIVVTALLESILALSNVMIVILMTWLVFAILGVSLFAGKLHSCSNDEIDSQSLCESSGYDWENSDFNFDNVYEALIVMFIISSQESWPDRMYEGIDIRSEGLSPKRNSTPAVAFYYIASVLIANMFLTNLFAAVVFSKFTAAKQNEESYASLLLSKDQLLWIHIMGLIVKEDPKSVTFIEPRNYFRKKVNLLISHVYFEVFMSFIIVLNSLAMAADFYEADQMYILVLNRINLVCTYLFIVEAGLKILGLGYKEYFYYNWNKFDFFVVLASIINLIMEAHSESDISILRTAPQLIRVIRVLRVTKIFRIFNFLRPLQHLILVVSYALPNIINVLLLLSLVFMIFAILGAFLFGNITSGARIDQYTNFKDFHHALFTLWRVSTGEDYPLIMSDCVHNVGKSSILYFVSFIGLTTFLMLDLFISIVIETYEDYESNPNSILVNFADKLENFKTVWGKYTQDSYGIRIYYTLLPKLMIDLGPELGVSEDLPLEKIIKVLNVIDMNIDNEGFTYFHDMLYAVMRRKYAIKLVNAQGQICQNRILLRNEETKTKMKISSIRIKNRKRVANRGVEGINKMTLNKGNAFVSWMYLRMVFQALKKWKDRKKLIIDQGYNSLEDNFDEEENF